MKKFLTLLLAAAMTLSLAACGSKNDGNANGGDSQPADALALLNTVWSSYADDDKFAVVGGDYDEANMTEDAPGRFGVEDGDTLDSMLGFPAADADKLTDAASLSHMMNANTFTCGALRVKNGRAQKILSGIMQYIIPPKWLYRWFFKSDADVEVAFMEAFPTKILAYSTNQHAKKYAWVHIDVQTYTKQDRLFRSMRHQKACYERFDGIYCVSENVQEAFSAKFGLTERVHVAYNMLDEQAIRRRKNEPVDDIPKGEFLMVSVGSLIPRKGFERLIHVCGRLKSRGYHFHLLILGKGELYEDLAEQVIDEHLLDSVQLLGFRDNPYPYMAAADLYVCPSYVEGFSTVVSEAVVLEKPVVTTDCSGMREILGDSEYGLITQNTEESLFEGLRTMLDKPEVYQYYQQRVRERAPFFYMEERLKAYEEILDQ